MEVRTAHKVAIVHAVIGCAIEYLQDVCHEKRQERGIHWSTLWEILCRDPESVPSDPEVAIGRIVACESTRFATEAAGEAYREARQGGKSPRMDAWSACEVPGAWSRRRMPRAPCFYP